ncbi:hypothetical protein L9F63_012016, partial [Diploptera punctata]
DYAATMRDYEEQRTCIKFCFKLAFECKTNKNIDRCSKHFERRFEHSSRTKIRGIAAVGPEKFWNVGFDCESGHSPFLCSDTRCVDGPGSCPASLDVQGMSKVSQNAPAGIFGRHSVFVH